MTPRINEGTKIYKKVTVSLYASPLQKIRNKENKNEHLASPQKKSKYLYNIASKKPALEFTNLIEIYLKN